MKNFFQRLNWYGKLCGRLLIYAFLLHYFGITSLFMYWAKTLQSTTADYLKCQTMPQNMESNNSVEAKDELLKEDPLNTEKIQDFQLVENRIDEIIKSAKYEIAILFCNLSTLKRSETQSILRFLKEKSRSDTVIRILFPFGVDDIIINSFSQIASVRIFEREIEDNNIIIVPDYTKVLLAQLQILINMVRKQHILYHILITKGELCIHNNIWKIMVTSNCNEIGGKIDHHLSDEPAQRYNSIFNLWNVLVAELVRLWHIYDQPKIMQGDSGNDQLSGGAGVNTLSGGPGKYSFICSPNSEYRFDPVRLLDASRQADRWKRQ